MAEPRQQDPHARRTGWSQDDIIRTAAPRAVLLGHRAAHKFLKQWRGQPGDRADQDLTDGEVFNWFAYLSNHSNP